MTFVAVLFYILAFVILDIPLLILQQRGNAVMANFKVSGQSKIGRELTLLALIQPTVIKQQAVNNNWLWKLQPAVILQSRQKSNLKRIECD